MRISDWSSDVCSSDLKSSNRAPYAAVCSRDEGDFALQSSRAGIARLPIRFGLKLLFFPGQIVFMNHGFGWGHDASPDFALNLQKQRTAGPSVPTIAAPFCAPGEPPAALNHWASASLAHLRQSRGDPHGPWMP